MPDSSPESIAALLDGLKAGMSNAQVDLYNRYFSRVASYANQKLQNVGGKRREADGEDAAQQALATVIRRMEAGEFDGLADAEGLWGLLLHVTACKAKNQARRERADIRGGGQVRGESVFLRADGSQANAGLGEAALDKQVAEDGEALLAALEDLLGPMDGELRSIALLKIQGHSNKEIAAAVSRSLATIERRLNLVRAMWREAATV